MTTEIDLQCAPVTPTASRVYQNLNAWIGITLDSYLALKALSLRYLKKRSSSSLTTADSCRINLANV